MTPRSLFRACVAMLAASLLASTVHAADVSGWTLDRLMSTLAHNKSGRATFTETKTLSIAAQPIESSPILESRQPLRLKITALVDTVHSAAGARSALSRAEWVNRTGRAKNSELCACLPSITYSLAKMACRYCGRTSRTAVMR